MVDVRRETIGHIEHNVYNLSLILAYEIARALKSTIEEGFVFEEDRQNSGRYFGGLWVRISHQKGPGSERGSPGPFWTYSISIL